MKSALLVLRSQSFYYFISKKFVCICNGICGVTSLNRTGGFYVSVLAPEFVKRLNSFVEATVGQDVLFECHWKAFPKPDIRWFRDEEEITHNPRYLIKEGDNGVLTLLIRKATKADEGAYKCRAENKEGLGSTTGYLSVKGSQLASANTNADP